jgi:hypothetical protein
MALVVLVPHKLDGVVGLDALEHGSPEGKQLLSWIDSQHFEVEFEDCPNVSWIFLSFPRPHALLQEGLTLLMQIQQFEEYPIQAESSFLPISVDLQFVGSNEVGDD